MQRLVTIFIALFFLSCSSADDRLEQALRLAGDNRPELEKVLRHYAQDPADSLQLRAARFLIENMPGHYTLAAPAVEEIRDRVYADTSVCYLSRRTIDIVLEQIYRLDHLPEREEDVHHVTADFLIRHIDASFRMFRDYPWLEVVPFDTFLDYLLPYRTEHERLQLWRDSLVAAPENLQEIAATDAVKYSLTLSEVIRFPRGQELLRDTDVSRVLGIGPVRSKCADQARRDVFRLRSIGIPAALDYVPSYANRDGEHHWYSVVGNDEMQMEYYRKAPKIFRYTYSRQPVPVPRKGEYIPPLFLDPFLKDVTDMYIPVANPVVKPVGNRTVANPHAYLCVFNKRKWLPACIGDADKREARFKNVGRNALYLPVAYQGRRQHHLHYPFVIDAEGSVRYLVPDTLSRLSVRLHRKYPTTLQVSRYSRIFDALSLSLMSDTCARDSVALRRVDTHQRYYGCWENPTQARTRYCELSLSYLPMSPNFSEIVFFDPEGKPVESKINPLYAQGFDGDPLTYCTFPHKGRILVDFGRPVAVSRVVLLARGDGNGVYPGDEYELFYHDLDGWRSLGRRVAIDYFLDYDNLPAGALYWLHNHTRGVEERPFTITPSGDIRFW